MAKRVILIVLDSFGVGALPDAEAYGDEGVNTALHIMQQHPKLSLINLQEMGLFRVIGDPMLEQSQKNVALKAAYGRAKERSCGKDTTVGHWEIAGVLTKTPFDTFPSGFPSDFMQAFEEKIGRKTIGNLVGSGTEILDALGEKHCQSGCPIVYTSADSVMQIAAHEQIIPPSQLYDICSAARELLDASPYTVARVIARPFEGDSGKFTRTANRHDFSLAPPQESMLNRLQTHGIKTIGVGKIGDIFAHSGLDLSIPTKHNMDGVDQTLAMMDQHAAGLIFTNLVDFDMKYGHRRDVIGYGDALQAFDDRLPEIVGKMTEEDLLILTADHGCDPTHSGSDHTREYIPLLVSGACVQKDVALEDRESFADISATILAYFGCEALPDGESMLSVLMQGNES